MSDNMTDLEWLARRVHKWTPDDPNHKLRLHKADALNAEGWTFSHCYSCGYSFDEWQAERARLQNKPNLSEWPKWAEYMGQCLDGDWRWFEREPKAGISLWKPGGRLFCSNTGEVLGDWRDTLERRPVSDMPPNHENMRCVMNSDIEKIEPDWSKAPEGATHYSEHGYMRWYKCENGGVCGYSDKRWVPLPLDVFSEKDKEALMEKPKEWRGPEDGLPPVGAALCSSGGDCVVMAVQDEAHICVQWIDGEIGIINAGCLRPRQSEEDKAVEDMFSTCHPGLEPSPHLKKLMENAFRILHKAGYRKQDASE